MHLLPRMNVMLDFILNAASPAERNTVQVNITKKKILSTVLKHGTTSRLQVHRLTHTAKSPMNEGINIHDVY